MKFMHSITVLVHLLLSPLDFQFIDSYLLMPPYKHGTDEKGPVHPEFLNKNSVSTSKKTRYDYRDSFIKAVYIKTTF
jgi:hypothetical protein